VALWAGEMVGSARAQTLFPTRRFSSPPDGEENVRSERGRKGLLFQFQFFNARGVEDDAAGFPLNMETATVSLTIGSNPALTCAAGINPAAEACGYRVVAGADDPALDTVEIFYNGAFPANTQVKYSVSGARSAGLVNQSGDPNVVSFTSGTAAPRPAASIEIVFQISRSLYRSAVPGGRVPRIDALKSAAQSFFGLLDHYAMLGDRVGAVYFADRASTFDPTPGGTNLEPAHDKAQVNLIVTDLQARSVIDTFWTSIGMGLSWADQFNLALDANPIKRVLLFSDGEQTEFPFVGVAGAPPVLQVNGVNYNPAIKVCPITAGRASAPGSALLQNIANASCIGKNAHIRDTEETFVRSDLETFFLQSLSDILVGDKLEMVKDLTGRFTQGVDLKEKFRANTGDVTLSILLSWSAPDQNSEQHLLPFRLIAPDGTAVDLTHRARTGRNMSFTTVHFPLRDKNRVIDPKGSWTIELLGSQIRAPRLDYHLAVMLDNEALASDFSLRSRDVGTGEEIPLRVRLTDGERPALGATVVAQVEGPATGLGDILSTTQAPERQPAVPGDTSRSPAQAKLQLLLTGPAFASLFKNKTLPGIKLLDNGLAANGDAKAGDGVYSAIFRGAVEEGHYHFAINATGPSSHKGQFQRTRRLSVFVRPKADPTATALQVVSTEKVPGGAMDVRLRATPRDRLRNLLGPDYLDHLKISSSIGDADGRLEDKLNGSYEVTFRLPSASANPVITLEVMGERVIARRLKELK
jgi:hypothetical protein